MTVIEVNLYVQKFRMCIASLRL